LFLLKEDALKMVLVVGVKLQQIQSSRQSLQIEPLLVFASGQVLWGIAADAFALDIAQKEACIAGVCQFKGGGDAALGGIRVGR
jgi:hypothetical protein